MKLARGWPLSRELGLESRAIALATSMLFVIAATMAGYGVVKSRELLTESAAGRLQTLHRALALACDFPMFVGNRGELERELRNFMTDEPIAYCVVEDAQSRILARRVHPSYGGAAPSSVSAVLPLAPGILEAVREVTMPVETSAEAQMVGQAPGRESTRAVGRIRLALSLQEYEVRVAQLRVRLLGASGGLFLIVCAATGFLMRQVTRPLRTMAQLAERVASGDLQATIPGDFAGELGALGSSLNRMVAALSRNRAEIEQIQATLEDRVRERSSELLEAQQAVAHASRLAAVGELAAGVAHEVNNPLDGIMGMSRLLRKSAGGDERANRQLDSIDDCSRRIAAITRNLLIFSRQEQASFTEQHVGDGIELALSLVGNNLRLKSSIAVSCSIPPGLPRIRVKGNQLEQVWINLLNNARQALDTLPGLRRLDIEAKATEDRQWVEVVVRDNGPGIPAETLGRIFEPFFTTKGRDKGTGLGLSISYGIVKDHGGELVANSEPGQGATFTVRVPAVDRKAIA